MPFNFDGQSLDVPFEVPFVHRLRFTRDVLHCDEQVLVDLLEASGDRKPRVQFWLDAGVAAGRLDLRDAVEQFCSRHTDKFDLVGAVQTVPGGEEIKNDIHVLERMLKIINYYDLDRRSYIVVIGGGAVLDAVGFAAAIAHRGIRLVRLPTTTLSQDDSGVGVKNGVNLFGKKNWLGSFASPWAVVNDAALLDTLSDRDFRCGFSEAVKVSLLKDKPFFDTLCQTAKQIAARQPEASLHAIKQSALWHLNHITRGGDPFEMLEARPLDFGHWSAHKLEAMTEFSLRHGEAVGIGVAIDTMYSVRMFGMPANDARRVLRCLADLGLPLDHPELANHDVLFNGLEEFRQHLGGRLTLTMLRGVGDPLEVHEVDREQMLAAIADVRAFAAKHVKATA